MVVNPLTEHTCNNPTLPGEPKRVLLLLIRAQLINIKSLEFPENVCPIYTHTERGRGDPIFPGSGYYVPTNVLFQSPAYTIAGAKLSLSLGFWVEIYEIYLCGLWDSHGRWKPHSIYSISSQEQ